MSQAPASAIDKKAISHAFSNSAASYDSGAALQRRVGSQLIKQLKPANCILDLGTGPGYFTSDLAQRCNQLIGVDIAPNMLQFARARNNDITSQHVMWLAGDAEQLPMMSNSVNGIFSSLMLQWVHQLSAALNEAYRVLDAGGEFVFTTLVDGTLYELADAWSHVDDLQHVNSFLTYKALTQAIDDSPFELISLTVEPEVIYYQNVIDLMRDLKAIGANQTAAGTTGLMGRGALKKLSQGYEKYRTSRGLSTTYQVAFCRLCKPN